MSNIESTITINGVEYRAQLGEIEGTMLGFEDHGFLTCILDLDFKGTGQGFGVTVLGMPERSDKPVELSTHTERWVRGILHVAGVDTWEKLKGKHIHALRLDHWGTIEGILSWDGERSFFAKVPE